MSNNKLRNLFTTMLLVTICLVGISFAGTTGKIAGVVTDAATGDPLPGANVVLDGTSMGAATGLEGTYNVLNVPPGLYTLRFSMMGYANFIVENVRVSIDMTTTIDAELSETALSGEEVTIVAERPLVKKDMTSSMSSVAADEIEAMPVQSVGEVLQLQAGIVQSGGELHIRGGRGGEVAFWVDGVSVTDVFSNDMGVTVENSAVQELQVVSGTFNAEYGKAMSGIINIVTKEGGSKYTGRVQGYVGDYVSNAKEFRVLDHVSTYVDDEGKTQEVGSYVNPLADFNPQYDGQFSLSGPVPGLGDNFTFFANGRVENREGYLYGSSWYTPIGAAGDSTITPMNPFEKYSAQLKMTWRMNSNIKMSYNVFWNQSHSDRRYSQDFKYNPFGVPSSDGGGMTHIFVMTHTISPTTFYEVRLNRFSNEYSQQVYDDPERSATYLVSVSEDTSLGIASEIFDPSTDVGQARLQELQDLRATWTYIVNQNGPEGYLSPDSNKSPATYSFRNVGMDMGHYERKTEYSVAKFDFTSQINNANQVKFGVEYRNTNLYMKSFSIRAKLDETGSPYYPFRPTVPDPSSLYYSTYDENPVEFSAYLQDKIELRDIILNLGLRFDYFDSNGELPTDPQDIDIYKPFSDEYIYKNPGAAEDDLVEYTPEERKAFMRKGVDAKMQVSPRIGIAYPITDRGVIHFSYGHFFQIPEFQYLYSTPGFKLNSGGGYRLFGNPDLNAQKTVQYEIGLQQQLSETVGIDVTLFYRDVRDWVGASPLIDTPNPSVKYSLYENKDYSNVRGITFKLDKRFASNFSAHVDYSFQTAEGTYSNPQDAFNAQSAQEEPRLALIPMAWDQRHTLNASLIYRIKDYTVSMIGTYWTGLPYTPAWSRGSVTGGSALVGLRENSERRPDKKNVDVRVSRRLKVGNNSLELFAYINNLFDIRNELAVYGDTGSAYYSTNIDPTRETYKERRVGTVAEFVNQPGWFSAPREIQVGMAFNF